MDNNGDKLETLWTLFYLKTLVDALESFKNDNSSEDYFDSDNLYLEWDLSKLRAKMTYKDNL